MEFRYVFGPVASRRLGRSLGVDLLGEKICTLDCLYCEVGATRRCTLERAPYVPAVDILAELETWKSASHPPLDIVTLGGSGEPCLNSELGAVLTGCRELFPGIALGVLTNSTLLYDPGVREELCLADVVLPSMDTLVPAEFQRLNRPHAHISQAGELERMARSLLEFRRMFQGRVFLEILLCHGINDSAENLERMQEYVRELQPQRVDVTTMSRPGAHPEAGAVSTEVLAQWQRAMDAQLDVPAMEATRPSQVGDMDAAERPAEELVHEIVASLKRRGQTPSQLSTALGVPARAVDKVLAHLLEQGLVGKEGGAGEETGGEEFYKA